MKIIRPHAKVFAGRLDPVPFINILFLLLIFFLISSSLVFQPGIQVDLPPAQNPTMNATDKLVITITRNSLVFFNDKRVEWSDLERELRNLILDSKIATSRRNNIRVTGIGDKGVRNPAVVLRADSSVSYERVMEVVSLARSLDLGVYMATALPKPVKPQPKTME